MTEPSLRAWATAPFRKSSVSDTNGGQCVEVGARPGVIGVRDSKNPGAGLIELPPPAWMGFLSALRAEA